MLKMSVLKRSLSALRPASVLVGQQYRASTARVVSTSKINHSSPFPARKHIPATTEQLLALNPALDGVWHGQESGRVLEGNFYDGEFVQGLWHGRGKLHLEDGTVYDGEFFEGRRNGRGTLIRKDGSELVGVWENGSLSEKISEKPPLPADPTDLHTAVTQKNEKKLNHHRNVKHAKAQASNSIEASSRVFNASVTSPPAASTYAPHSSATIAETTTNTNGQRVVTYSNGDVYTGDLVDGKKHGYGVLNFGDGGQYEGEWKDNAQHGQGTAAYTFGATYTGAWAHGQHHGQGTLSYTDGRKGFVGEFKQGKVYNGSGRYVSYSKAEFTGTWVDGLLEGAGSIWSNEHSHASGVFRQGKVFDGARVYRDSSNRVFKVTYAAGKQIKNKRIL